MMQSRTLNIYANAKTIELGHKANIMYWLSRWWIRFRWMNRDSALICVKRQLCCWKPALLVQCCYSNCYGGIGRLFYFCFQYPAMNPFQVKDCFREVRTWTMISMARLNIQPRFQQRMSRTVQSCLTRALEQNRSEIFLLLAPQRVMFKAAKLQSTTSAI